MSAAAAWEFAGKTDLGCVRANNEDSFLIDKALGLLIVADGMGGYDFGEVASALAVRAIRDAAASAARSRNLEGFIQSANVLIREKARDYPGHAGMGTTVVAVLADERSLTVGHVGDSRCYLFRRGILSRLTQDHSLAQKSQGLRHILTRAVGADEMVQVDVSRRPVRPGDVLLLATDGLTTMVGDEEIGRILRENPSVSGAAAALVERARRAGGSDNITVICGRLGEFGPQGLRNRATAFFRRFQR